MTTETDFPLQKYNSFNVRSVAKCFIAIENEYDLQRVITDKMLHKSKFLILGNGTNVLFTNEYYDGIVLKNNIKTKLNIELKKDEIEIVASSGVDFDLLICEQIKFQQKQQITAFGLENLALIPGNVGAAVVQNIGAFGVEQKDYFVRCSAINLTTGEKQVFSKQDCEFGYRSSRFKTDFANYFITDVTYSIPVNSEPILTYGGLRNQLENKKLNLSPASIYDAIKNVREQKIPSLAEFPNVGSFFKNPIITAEKLERILAITPSINYFADGDVIKVAAASLIEHSGLKGARHGDVGVSGKHALILVNHGKATGSEIVAFSNYIIAEVNRKYGVKITPEVVFV